MSAWEVSPDVERCSNCHFWQKQSLYSDGPWGKCGLSAHQGGKLEYDDPGWRCGMVADGLPQGRDGYLATRYDFGCIGFRKATQEPAP